MLKGHVFKEQVFGNQIFALFINTFLNGQNGISNNYKNGMQITYSGTNLTIQSGAICIQGRFLEEDTSTDISVGTDSSYSKLVIEIDLDKQNTESELAQASYKIVKSSSGYPNLTQNDIVKNNAGIYQYELARFRTSASGITDFQDKRTFLDFDSIYEQIQSNYQSILDELEQELANVKDGSDYLLKSSGGTVEGPINASGGISGNLTGNVKGNVTGNVSGSSGSCTGNASTATRLQNSRNISLTGDVTGSANFNGSQNISINAKLAKTYEQKIQFGSNSRGNYAQFNDGTLIQWGTYTESNVTFNISVGTFYRCTLKQFPNFPKNFAGDATDINVFIEIQNISNASVAFVGKYGSGDMSNAPSLLNPGRFSIMKDTNANSDIRVGYFAIGRWK